MSMPGLYDYVRPNDYATEAPERWLWSPVLGAPSPFRARRPPAVLRLRPCAALRCEEMTLPFWSDDPAGPPSDGHAW